MALIQQTDYGTPKRNSETLVTLEIDGKPVTVPAGTSVMRAAAEVGVQVPKLCASDNLEPFGSCRLCLIEVEGRKGTPASCTTPAEQGMKVRTQSPKLSKLRMGVMELYASDYPRDMFENSASGNTEFQQMVTAVGLRDVRYGYSGKNHQSAEKDESNPYFEFDPAKCIVCSRCVRACEEVQGTFALTIDGRGFASAVSAGDKPFLESECVSCGACVQACPTGSLLEKSVIENGQPDRSVVTTCAYCGVGCSFVAELRATKSSA
jgi:formate dehydrogenase major subunit